MGPPGEGEAVAGEGAVMTADDVTRALRDIEAKSGDPEAAHSAEDRLYRRTLRAIAERSPDAAGLAAEAIKAADIKFERWYA